jgi:hypothetical protein
MGLFVHLVVSRGMHMCYKMWQGFAMNLYTREASAYFVYKGQRAATAQACAQLAHNLAAYYF